MSLSRVAKNPVQIPDKVEVVLSGHEVVVKGPLGSLRQQLLSDVKLEQAGNTITIDVTNSSKHARAMSGTTRALLANMVKGVSQGFERKLLLVGVGYRAQASSETLNLELGYSHPVQYPIPQGITITTPIATEILIKGADKQVVGQVAAQIRAYRKPEPYKGKGVRYANEVVVIKETKKK